MAFAVGDLVAHPLHGAGVVDSIEKEKRGGVVREYYVMRVGPGDMLVKIPTDTSDAVGVRPIVSAERADERYGWNAVKAGKEIPGKGF